MSKQTRLNDDAFIYQPRQQLTEKEKLKNMSSKEKLVYLWEYYRIHVAVTIGIIALLSYIIYSIITPNIVTRFYAAFIDCSVDAEVLEKYRNDFSEYLELNPNTETVNFNTSFYLSSDSEYAMTMKQALVTYVSAQEIDVIIAPESQFSDYAYYGYFDKVSDQLPTDIYSNLTDYLYMSKTEENPVQYSYGIYLTETELFKPYQDASDPYVLGIVANSKHKENAIEFIRTLFR